ncbi:MAG: hypothetical protein WD273_10520 [Trueperaceae bacterium]
MTHRATGGMLGNSGAFSQEGLLDLALRLSCSGTLAVRYPGGTRLLLLDNGRIKSSFDLGTPGEASSSGVDFHFEPHHVADVAQLSSPFPSSVLGVMRALPIFGPAQPLPTGLVDLRALVSRAKAERLTGALTVAGAATSPDGATPATADLAAATAPMRPADKASTTSTTTPVATSNRAERGVALFHEGRIGAAFFEREGQVWERSDALRAIYRYSLESERPPMLLHPIGGELMRGLLGLALERRAAAGDPNNYTGVTASEGGYTFYCEGKPYLHLAAQLLGTGGRFTPLETVPDLQLPDDPPGWERRRFDLTLRGRDALNPMTELSMKFGDNYGVNGRNVLEAIRRGLSIEDAAARLEIDLQELKPWLERLQSDGLIRPRN